MWAICYVVKLLKQEVALLKNYKFLVSVHVCACLFIHVWRGEGCLGQWNTEDINPEIFQSSDNQTLAH